MLFVSVSLLLLVLRRPRDVWWYGLSGGQTLVWRLYMTMEQNGTDTEYIEGDNNNSFHEIVNSANQRHLPPSVLHYRRQDCCSNRSMGEYR
jgi:hypothetical protein